MIIVVQAKNWKWIIFFLVVVLIIIMLWKSQQRIKELDKQLYHSQTKYTASKDFIYE
jgi:short subunit fatty acids transporter